MEKIPAYEIFGTFAGTDPTMGTDSLEKLSVIQFGSTIDFV